jgi:DNA-directed RNA polymerase beta' subunit
MNHDKEIRLVKLDWNEECERDFIIGTGFEVTEPAFQSREQKSMYGIHSPLFATDWEDEDAFAERYTCQCGELKGRVYEGEICPRCKTKVKFRDVDLRITGWIKLYNHAIIQPIFYKMLKSIIGEKTFLEIIEFDKEITRDGVIINKKSKNPFKGIGLVEFRERFDEIIEFYRKKKKNKAELIEEVLSEKEKIFSNCIPVYSSVLRPVSFKNETFFFNSIDRKYNSIYSLTRLLNDSDLLEIKKKKNRKKSMDESTVLQSVQKKLMELWDLIFMQINQKDGHIKDQILGGRINFSARNVIIPDPTLKADEIKLGYLAFLELYKYEIIAHLAKMNDISENEAYDQWYRATINFNQKIYEIMMYLVKKIKPRVVINRNPTINYGSMLAMKVVEVKAEYKDDFTMSLPIQILRVLNADFDGDILNIISLKVKKLIKAYDRTFNPRKNMFISRNDGRFNNDFNLFKDQLIGLYEFNNI